MPVSTMAERGPIGSGAARAVALGGGGEWFIAWMLGYANGLLGAGVDLAKADVTIGTSAGSLVGAAIKGGRLIAETMHAQGFNVTPAPGKDQQQLSLLLSSETLNRDKPRVTSCPDFPRSCFADSSKYRRCPDRQGGVSRTRSSRRWSSAPRRTWSPSVAPCREAPR
jgi:hypothetical protein